MAVVNVGTDGTDDPNLEVGEEVVGERLFMDFVDARACELLPDVRGFETRLAKDWELLDIRSSGTKRFLCVDRVAEPGEFGARD